MVFMVWEDKDVQSLFGYCKEEEEEKKMKENS